MKLNKQQIFARLGDVDDAYIDESALPEEPLAIPPKRRRAVAAFFEKPAVVAAVCAIVALGTVVGIFMAGQADPMPPIPPANSEEETVSPEDMAKHLVFKSNGDGTCAVQVISTPESGKIVIPPISPEGDTVTVFEGAGVMELPHTGVGRYPISLDSLTAVALPETVTEILYEGLVATNLREITVDETNPVFYAQNNCLILRESQALVIACPGSYVIPEGVKEIATDFLFFLGREKIPPSPLYIPASLTGRLRHISFLAPLSEITVHPDNSVYYAEGGCLIERETMTVMRGSIHSIVPEGVLTIDGYAFTGAGTVSLHLPSTLRSVDYLFMGANHLADLTTITSNTQPPSDEPVRVAKGELPPVIFHAESNCLYRYEPLVVEEAEDYDTVLYQRTLILTARNADHSISEVSRVESTAVMLPPQGITLSVEISAYTGKNLHVSDHIVGLSFSNQYGHLDLTLRSQVDILVDSHASLLGSNIVMDATRLVVEDIPGYPAIDFSHCTSVTLPAIIAGHKNGEIHPLTEGHPYLKFYNDLQELHYGGTAEQWAHYSQFFDFTECRETVTVYCADGTELVAWEPQEAESK